MPELTIIYNDKRTLKALLDFSKYFDFSIVEPQKTDRKKETELNGVPFISGDNSIDTSELESIFTGKAIDSKLLREQAWKRAM